MSQTTVQKAFFSLLLIVGAISCKKNQPNIVISNQTYDVVVNNGYGSCKFAIGDTVHIWSKELSNTEIFTNWTGYDPLLEHKGEWHNSFIMPANNVTVNAETRAIPAVNINFEMIQGKNIAKKVYYNFPSNYKGVVYLLHGTGGNAQNWISGYEYRALIKDLVVDNFAIVVNEAEEISLNQDLNSDGKLRWAVAPLDSNTNIDLANIKAITSNLYSRGIADISRPRFSIGMSNGSSFSGALSALYRFKAGVGYCAPITQAVVSNTQTPFIFCMATNDGNENVGPAGNASAFSQQQFILSRGICSKYSSRNASPLYPERFARTGDITVANSISIFNELKNANLLDSKNYFTKNKDQILATLQANPSSFPTLNSLLASQKNAALNQLEVTISDHEFFSDYNKKVINFLNNQCQ